MKLSDAVLSTLAYHDIFNYPLTVGETHQFCPYKTSEEKVQKELKNLHKTKKIEKYFNYYSLKGKGTISHVRQKKRIHSHNKTVKARTYAKILNLFPHIQLIALTGALAMENSDKNDDIDFLIITSKNYLWSTRLASNLLLSRYRRKPAQKKTKNKACLNIFLAENSLKIRTQNLYTAHEIAQMKPILQRGNAYFRFLNANSWVKNYLPNWKPVQADSIQTYPHLNFHALNFPLIEPLSKKLQLWHMKPKITTEKIGESQLFFHPENKQEWVLAEYNKRLKKLKIT